MDQDKENRNGDEPTGLPFNLSDDDLEITADESETGALSWEDTKKQIGAIVIEHQLMETSVRTGIATLLSPNDLAIGYLMTADMSFERMISVLFAVFCHLHPDHSDTDKFKALLTECNWCRERRNFIVHSSWYPLSNAPGNLVIKYRKTNFGKPFKSSEYIDEISAATLKADAERFSDISTRLREFINGILPEEMDDTALP